MPDLNTLLDQHVTLVYESVDRIFLNGYVARLQEPDQLAWFLGQHRGEALPCYELLGKMTRDFVAAVEQLAQDRGIPVLHFEKGQRKEAIAEPYFAQAALLQREGVVLIGIAQEKANVFRPPSKGRRGGGGGFAAGRNSAFVKHLYFYIWDRDFGSSFVKFCTYAPWSVRVCLNGHMWLRQHLRRSGHWVVPLDNGIADVDDAAALARLCRRFGPQHIQRYFDRWMYRLPSPFSALDRRAGYTYQLSILQLESVGLSEVVEFVVGEAYEVCASFVNTSRRFDLVFLDSAESQYPILYPLCVQLLRRRGILLVNNVLMPTVDGWTTGRNVVQSPGVEPIASLRTMLKMASRDPEVMVSILPMGSGILLCSKV